MYKSLNVNLVPYVAQKRASFFNEIYSYATIPKSLDDIIPYIACLSIVLSEINPNTNCSEFLPFECDNNLLHFDRKLFFSNKNHGSKHKYTLALQLDPNSFIAHANADNRDCRACMTANNSQA